MAATAPLSLRRAGQRLRATAYPPGTPSGLVRTGRNGARIGWVFLFISAAMLAWFFLRLDGTLGTSVPILLAALLPVATIALFKTMELGGRADLDVAVQECGGRFVGAWSPTFMNPITAVVGVAVANGDVRWFSVWHLRLPELREFEATLHPSGQVSVRFHPLTRVAVSIRDGDGPEVDLRVREGENRRRRSPA